MEFQISAADVAVVFFFSVGIAGMILVCICELGKPKGKRKQ